LDVLHSFCAAHTKLLKIIIILLMDDGSPMG